jgi:hypothetical protein
LAIGFFISDATTNSFELTAGLTYDPNFNAELSGLYEITDPLGNPIGMIGEAGDRASEMVEAEGAEVLLKN